MCLDLSFISNIDSSLICKYSKLQKKSISEKILISSMLAKGCSDCRTQTLEAVWDKDGDSHCHHVNDVIISPRDKCLRDLLEASGWAKIWIESLFSWPWSAVTKPYSFLHMCQYLSYKYLSVFCLFVWHIFIWTEARKSKSKHHPPVFLMLIPHLGLLSPSGRITNTEVL